MENTLENKAKFFAQHLGQKILIEDITVIHPMQIIGIDIELGVHVYDAGIKLRGYYPLFDSLLELRPLSSITDEDFNLIMKDEIMNPEPSIGDPVFTFEIGGLKLSDLTTTDYLRSKGYALPWMGLSVEELVNFGWIKLKEN